MKDRELLLNLLRLDGVSGGEESVVDWCAEYLSCAADQSSLGSGIFRLQSQENGPHIVLEAHMDTIGLVVTSRTEEGFLSVAPVGGIDSRLLPATVLRSVRDGTPAVVCSTPPHLAKGDSRMVPIDELWLDTGGNKTVQVGDRFVFAGEPVDLGDRIVSPGLDNRAGVCAVLMAAKAVLEKGFSGSLTVLLSSMEETGEQGAAAAAFALQPDLCLCVDVSFAYRDGLPKHKCGIGGKGPMVGYAPSLPRRISDGLCAIAQTKGIPFQREIMSGTTGTDADRITISGKGVTVGLVSIPLYEMHTPRESIWFRDLEQTAQLLAAGCEGGLLQ